MRKTFLSIILIIFVMNCYAITSNEMLNKIKNAETKLNSLEANINPVGNKKNLSSYGKQLDLLADVKNGTFKYKKGNRIRIEGKIKNIKVSAIENGYKIKYNIGVLKGTMDKKDEPGKRYSSVDLCFLSSWLWSNNKVTVLSIDSNGICKVKFDPIQGGNEKRYDLIWIDSKTLKMIKREKYNTDGILKLTILYKEWKEFLPGYYIATKYETYNPKKELLGSNIITNIKVNVAMSDNLFSVN